MAENPNIVFNKETLFERVWGLDAVGDTTTVTVHVNPPSRKNRKLTIVNRAISRPFGEQVIGLKYKFKKD